MVHISYGLDRLLPGQKFALCPSSMTECDIYEICEISYYYVLIGSFKTASVYSVIYTIESRMRHTSPTSSEEEVITWETLAKTAQKQEVITQHDWENLDEHMHVYMVEGLGSEVVFYLPSEFKDSFGDRRHVVDVSGASLLCGARVLRLCLLEHGIALTLSQTKNLIQTVITQKKIELGDENFNEMFSFNSENNFQSDILILTASLYSVEMVFFTVSENSVDYYKSSGFNFEKKAYCLWRQGHYMYLSSAEGNTNITVSIGGPKFSTSRIDSMIKDNEYYSPSVYSRPDNDDLFKSEVIESVEEDTRESSGEPDITEGTENTQTENVNNDWAEEVQEQEDNEHNEEENPEEENSNKEDWTEEDISEQSEHDFEVYEESEENTCCKTPSSISLDQRKILLHCLKQFKDQSPKISCTLNLFKISNSFLRLISSKDTIDDIDISIIDLWLKLRHDIMSYIFLNYYLNYGSPFGTDHSLRQMFGIDSNKTPDYVRIENNKVSIFEFSVVNNIYRGMANKGHNNDTSKYKDQIIAIEALGFQCTYFPIIYALNSSLQENVDRFVTICDGTPDSRFMDLIEEWESCIDRELDNFTAMNFTRSFDREFYEAERKIEKLMNKQHWKLISLTVNKINWYRLCFSIKTTPIQPDVFYQVKYRKLGVELSPRRNGIQGSKINTDKNLSLENCVYKNFFKHDKNLQGSDEIFFVTDEYDLETANIEHCNPTSKEDDPHKVGYILKNYRRVDMIDISQFKSMESYLMNNSEITKLAHLNTQKEIDDAIKTYSEKLKDSNKISQNVVPPVYYNPRRSFQLFAETTNISVVNYNSEIDLTPFRSCKSPSINMICDAAEKQNYQFDVVRIEQGDEDFESLLKSVREYNKEYQSIVLQNFGKHTKWNNIKISGKTEIIEKLEIVKDNLFKVRLELTKKMSYRKRNRVVLNSDIKKQIKVEKNWGSNSGYNIYGFNPELDFTMEDIYKMLWSPCKPLSPAIELPVPKNDPKLYLQIKEKFNDNLKKYFNEISTTSIYNNFLVLSKLAYALIAISNYTANGNYITLDHLGLRNCLLVVKGGQKISRSRKTKIFKFIYPCNSNLHFLNTSKRIFEHNGQMFEETPWQQWHQQIALDYISCEYKLLSTYCMLRDKYDKPDCFRILTMPCSLLLHNRRKTEQTLHNIRYIIVNVMGEYSRVSEMLPEFATTNYTSFENIIKVNIMKNYSDYCDKVKLWKDSGSLEQETFEQLNIKNPVTGFNIKSIDDVTFMIYSTYMMTKAPVEQGLEQANNLKSIMATHDVYSEDKRVHEVSYHENTDDDDFSYCPDTCYTVGKLLSAKLRSKKAMINLNIQWSRLMTKPIDEMANNRGLRDRDEEFFGKKGYYVVYKKLLEDKSKLDELNTILDGGDIKMINRRIQELNRDFASEQKDRKLDKCIFHVVDKLQRAGSREIYVMDFLTKLYQYPIEKMFGYICSFFPEELISIPSSKRAGVIHHKLFEKPGKYTITYLTLDCRKWAPRSSPEKYIYMILGMAEVLPDDFIKSVIHYFLRHEKKEIHTRARIAKLFLSNPENKKYEKYFEFDDEKDSAFFKMNYSFVMGIFNFLSSLMHVGIQFLSKHIMEKQICMSGGYCNFSMFGHSDDSGGSLTVSDESYIPYCLSTHERCSKLVNHLMSLKKCNVSKFYFELLSVLYINKQFLPLISKFVQNISFIPSGQGLSADFKTVISKSIELLSNGGTISMAYYTQIIMSNMYRRFYRVGPHSITPSIGGYVDSLPHMYLMFGSQIDEYRLLRYNNDLYIRYMSTMLKYLDCDFEDGMPMLKYMNRVRIPKHFEIFDQIQLPEFEDNEWFFSQNKTRSSLLNLFWMKSMLKNTNFAVSLLQINDIKRYLDTLYMASGKRIMTNNEPIDCNDIVTLVLSENKDINYYKDSVNELTSMLKSQHSSCSDYYDYLENHPDLILIRKITHTDKPCTLHMTRYNNLPLMDKNSLHLAVDMVRPELKKYTYSNLNFGPELNTLKNYIESTGINTNLKNYYSFVNYLKKNVNKTMHVYSAMPTDQRTMYDEPGLHEYLRYNLHPDLIIKETSYRFITKQSDPTIGVEFNREVSQILTILVLHRAVLHSKLEYLDDLYLSEAFDNVQIRDAYPLSLSKLKNRSYADFMYLSMATANQKVDLNNYDNFAFWNQRQIKTKSGWVGRGSLVMRIDGTNINFIMKNRQVESVHISHDIEGKIFSEQASEFIIIFFKTLNIDFVFSNYDFSDKVRFGYNRENRLGFHKSKECTLIIGFDLLLDFVDLDMSGGSYKYINSKHTYTVKGKTIPLETFDTCLLRKEGLASFLEILDMEGNNEEEINQLCGIMLTNHQEFGREYAYDIEDLFKNFRGSELYRFMIQHMEKKNGNKVTPIRFIWEDMMNNMKTDVELKESLESIFSGTEIGDLIDDENLNQINRFLLYEIDDINLLRFKESLAGLSREEMMTTILSKMRNIGVEQTSLILMDDVGSYDSFKKFNKLNAKKFDISTVHGILRDLNYSITSVVEDFSEMKKQDLLYPFLDSRKLNGQTLDKLLEMMFYADYTATSFLRSLPGIQFYLVLIKRMLKNIFSNHQTFSDWSNYASNTMLRLFPRLPQFEDEWLKLTEDLYEIMLMKAVQRERDESEQIKTRQFYRRMKTTNLLFQKSKDGKFEFKLRKLVPAELEDIYAPLYYSTKYTYGKNLNLEITDIVMSGLHENVYHKQGNEDIKDTIALDYDVRLRPHSNFFHKYKDVHTNKGEFMIGLGPIEAALCLQTNLFKRNFVPVITDSYIETTRPPIIIDGSLLNLEHNMFLYIPEDDNMAKLISGSTSKLDQSTKNEFDDVIYSISSDDFEIMDLLNETNERQVDIGEKIASLETNLVYDNFDIMSDKSYNNELVEFLISNYKVSDEDATKIENIVFSQNTPIKKFQQIRKIIKKTSINSDSFEQVLAEALGETINSIEGFDENKSKINRIEKYLTSINYNINGLLKTTSDPVAIKQLDDLTGGLLIDILRKEVNITNTAKKHLLSTYKMLFMQNKGTTRKDIRAALRFMIDMLEEIDSSNFTNKQGSRLIEIYMSYHTDIVDESDIDEEYEMPTFKRSINTNIKKR
jgi:hypothetical protein